MSGQTLLSLREFTNVLDYEDHAHMGEVCLLFDEGNWSTASHNLVICTHLGQVTVVPNVPLKVLTSIC